MTDYTSSQNGSWNDSATWGGGGFPVLGDRAIIQSGHTVTIDSDAAVGTDTLTTPTAALAAQHDLVISGTLEWDTSPAADYTLTIDGHTLVDNNAVFEIGSVANPIPADRVAKVYFPDGISIRYVTMYPTTALMRVYGSATAHRADAASQKTTVKTAFGMGTGVTVEFDDDVDYSVGDEVLLGMGGDKSKQISERYTGRGPFPLLKASVLAGSDITFESTGIYDYWFVGDKFYFNDGANSEVVTIKTRVEVWNAITYTADFAYPHAANTPFFYYGTEKVVIQTKINASTYTVNTLRNHVAGDVAIHWERNVVFEGENSRGPRFFSFGAMYKVDINWASFVEPGDNCFFSPNYQAMTNGDLKIKNVLSWHETMWTPFIRFPYQGVMTLTDEDIDEVHMHHGNNLEMNQSVGIVTLGHISCINTKTSVCPTADSVINMKGLWYIGNPDGSYVNAVYQQGGRLDSVKIHYTTGCGIRLEHDINKTYQCFTLGNGEVLHCYTYGILINASTYVEIKGVAFSYIESNGWHVNGNGNGGGLFQNCSFDSCNTYGNGEVNKGGVSIYSNITNMTQTLFEFHECDFGMIVQNKRTNLVIISSDMNSIGHRIILDKCRFRRPYLPEQDAGWENELACILGCSSFSNIYTRVLCNDNFSLEIIEPEVYSVNDVGTGTCYWSFGGTATNDSLVLEGDIAQDFEPAQHTGSFTVMGRFDAVTVGDLGGLMGKWNEASDDRCWRVYMEGGSLKFAVSKSGLDGGDVTEIAQSGIVGAYRSFCARYEYVADGTSVMKLEYAGVETSVSNAVGPVHASENADVIVAGSVNDDVHYYRGSINWMTYLNRYVPDSEKDSFLAGSIKITDINPDDYIGFCRKVYGNARYPSDIGTHWYRVGDYGDTPSYYNPSSYSASRLDVDIWALNKGVDHFAVTGGGGTVEDETVEVIDNTFAVKMHPFSDSTRNSGTAPVPLLLPVNAGQTITVKLSLKKNKAVEVGKRPAIFLQGLGIIDEAESSATINAWEELTVTGTAVIQGMVKFWVSQGANEYDVVGATNSTLFPKSPDNITVYADKLVITRS